MHHLFYVFSTVTARMVPIAVEHLGLASESIVVLLDRNQDPRSITIPVTKITADLESFNNTWPLFYRNWGSLRRNSKRISHLLHNQKFTAYVPSPSFHTCQEIIHHPNCSRYYLIEEGLTSYCPPGVIPVKDNSDSNYRSFRLWIKYLINGLRRVRMTTTDFPVWKKKYAGAIASNDIVFPNFPGPVFNLATPLFHPSQTKFTKVVIMDKFLIFPREIHSKYIDVIRDIVKTQSSERDRWGYKLHPACENDKDLNRQLAHLFAENLPTGATFEKMPQQECAEDIGLCASVTTFGYMSSCLFYIDHYGGKAISFKDAIEEHEPVYRDIWKKYFPRELEELLEHLPQHSFHPKRTDDD